MRHIIFGDVHGCLDELDQALDNISPVEGDKIYFVGDLVDRGPNPIGVIKRVKFLVENYPGSVAVCGNHESVLIQRYRKFLKTGEANFFENYWWYLNEEQWAFLKSMPIYHRIKENNILIVHGGLYPRYFEHYETLQEFPENWQDHPNRKSISRMRPFMWTRHIDLDTGKPLRMGEETDKSINWYNWYDGREGLVVFGHQSRPTPFLSKYAVGLDTAIERGGSLSYAIFHSDTNGGECHSIPCRKIYYKKK